MNTTHLPINQQTHPKHWISLCNRSNVQFTLDFNDATCSECVAVELDAVHGPQQPYVEGVNVGV